MSASPVSPTSASSPRRGKKIIDLLRRLDPEERPLFSDYLRSPLLGNSPQFHHLLDFVVGEVLDKGKDSCSAEEFHAALFPDQPFDPARTKYIWVRLSQFHEKILDFIAFRRYQQSPGTRDQLLLEGIHARGWEGQLEKAFGRTLRRVGTTVSAGSIRQRLDARLIRTQLLNETSEPGQDTGIGDVLEELDIYYVIQKLKFACGELNHRLFAGPTLELKGLLYVQEMAAAPDLIQIPVVKAYLRASQMLEAEILGLPDSVGHYRELFALFRPPIPFSMEETRDLFACVQNFIVLKYHQCEGEYLADLKELYESMLELGLLEMGGKLSSMLLKNIVQLFCQSGNPAWAQSVLEVFRQRVTNDPLELAYHFNSAVVAFYRREYDTVLKLLYNRIGKFDNTAIEIAARVFLIRSLWHLADWDWLSSSVETFLKYLKRNRPHIGKANYQLYLPYAQHLKRAANALSSLPARRKKKLEACKVNLEEAGHTAIYAWLYREVCKLLEEG